LAAARARASRTRSCFKNNNGVRLQSGPGTADPAKPWPESISEQKDTLEVKLPHAKVAKDAKVSIRKPSIKRNDLTPGLFPRTEAFSKTDYALLSDSDLCVRQFPCCSTSDFRPPEKRPLEPRSSCRISRGGLFRRYRISQNRLGTFSDSDLCTAILKNPAVSRGFPPSRFGSGTTKGCSL
jgi:hypothetical protein